MAPLFRGCTYENSNGTRKLIAKGDYCIFRTNKCFWKDSADVNTRIKTRSMTKNKPPVSWETFNNYFKDKEKDIAIAQKCIVDLIIMQYILFKHVFYPRT